MRDRIEAAIKDAYYHARDNGGTMHTAAEDATDAVLAVLTEPDDEFVCEIERRVLAMDWVTQHELVENVLAALADTSAQPGHTDGDETGGGA